MNYQDRPENSELNSNNKRPNNSGNNENGNHKKYGKLVIIEVKIIILRYKKSFIELKA